jgi:hypothetical protein
MNMKKTILLLSMLLSAYLSKAQTNVSEQVYSYVLKHSADVDLQNKVMLINIWSTQNMDSRECNKAADKTMKTYQYAKLKGGARGMVVFDICIDNVGNSIQLTRQKDGIKFMIEIPYDKTSSFKEGNYTFDSNGKLITQNTQSAQIFESIHQLITR